MKKLISINILIFFIILLIIEILFGYWFDKNNFGIYMRSHRLKQNHYSTVFDAKRYNFFYKRNFYGFRGEEFNPKDVKIIFLGGSTGNQRYTPEEYTIVGKLNNFIQKDFDKLKIYNASTDGKTTRGYVNDFKIWFPKIPNFDPDIIIFYIGINDSVLTQPEKFDNLVSENLSEKIYDYIKNSSITYELIKKIKYKYFNKIQKRYDQTSIKKGLYKNYQYWNYKKALVNSKKNNLSTDQHLILKNFNERLRSLKFYINLYEITPIFITQIRFDGLKNNNLFLINEKLKNFCVKNSYYIIPLDELINQLDINDFYDEIHTTISGSDKIAKSIYLPIKNILEKYY